MDWGRAPLGEGKFGAVKNGEEPVPGKPFAFPYTLTHRKGTATQSLAYAFCKSVRGVESGPGLQRTATTSVEERGAGAEEKRRCGEMRQSKERERGVKAIGN